MITSTMQAVRRLAASGREAEPVARVTAEEQGGPRLLNFYECEAAAGVMFRWSRPVAMVRLRLPPDDYVVRLDTAALRGCTSHVPFNVYWNDEQIADEAIFASGREVLFRVARDQCVDSEDQRLLLVAEPLAAAPPDSRELGLPFVDLQVFAGEGSPRSGDTGPPPRRAFGRARTAWQGPAPHLPRWAIDGLRAVQAPRGAGPSGVGDDPTPTSVACESAVVCHNEINSRHGTGVLLQQMFPNLHTMAALESSRCYEGEHVPMAVTRELPHGVTRAEAYRCVHEWFAHAAPGRAHVVPYHASDLHMAMALRHLFGTRLVLHVMDDNTLVGHGIPCGLMEEAIENCDVRFVISPEMRTMYEQRFGRKFHLLPPVVSEDLVGLPFDGQPDPSLRGVIIGNIWSAEWIDHLVRTVRGSGIELDWFCNNPRLPWIGDNRRRLADAGIFVREPLWGEGLVRELRRRPFLVLPTGLPTDVSARAIARLSLPSRAVFHMAAVRTPIVVVGGRSTSVAAFVGRFQLGSVVPYEPQALREAVRDASSKATLERIRGTCGRLAPTFAARDLEGWIWNSMALGRPADERFESLWPRENGLTEYVAPDPPRGMFWARRAAWHMLERYARNGGRPRTILDIGASTGLWSEMAACVFPESHFVLCEPLFSRYPEDSRKVSIDALPSHEVVEKVVTSSCGRTSLLVSDSLYGSSLLAVDDVHGDTSHLPVECTTVDALHEERGWDGPILLKADVQFAEHLVIEGAAELLRSKVDAVFLELSLARGHADARTYAEMCVLMERLGFELFDEAEGWRDPRTARLEQKDVLFVRTKRAAQPADAGVRERRSG